MREAYGLNQSFLTRYWIWLTSMVQGDMGYSMAGGVAISEIMVKTVPATLELSMVALFFSTILGCSLGVISALKRVLVLIILLRLLEWLEFLYLNFFLDL